MKKGKIEGIHEDSGKAVAPYTRKKGVKQGKVVYDGRHNEITVNNEISENDENIKIYNETNSAYPRDLSPMDIPRRILVGFFQYTDTPLYKLLKKRK